MSAFIEVQNVSYAYPAPGGESIPALKGISLRIEAGEYVALIGANGSGKSTLARHLNALLLPDAGGVRVAGLDTRERSHHPTIHRTVGMVFQRPEDQLVATVVEEDVAFGPENMGVPSEEIRVRVRAALEAVDLWEERHRPPHMLSAGQMQRVALAGVLAMHPRCIVFDEATAMLDPAGRRAVQRMMARLHAEGLTVIAITHFMEEAALAERVIALADGQVALDGPPEAIFSDAAALRRLDLEPPPAALLARKVRAHVPALPREILDVPALVDALDALPHAETPPTFLAPPPAPAEQPLIEVHDLGHVYMRGTPLARRSLEEVELSVVPGGGHGLLGPTGSGKSTLMQHLNGLLRPQEGRVRVGEHDLADPQTDVQAVRRMVGLVFQLPEVQIFEQYVGDEIAFGPRLMGLEGEALRERVRWAMALVGLGFEAYKDRPTFALSGGERRKVALASTLALRPRVLLLDEPTAGLDPASRRELLGHLAEFRALGMTLLLASHQMEDLVRLVERLTVLQEGRSVLSGTTAEVFSRGELLRAQGLGVPVAVELAEGLRGRGWPLPQGLVHEEELVEALAELVRASRGVERPA
jgi:energy-coupling factor transport system ATP-binding protein